MTILSLISLVTFITMIIVNYLANSIPIGGNSTGDISGKYPTLFTPSGFTFSIWGIIYLLLGVFSILLLVNPDLIITHNIITILTLVSVVNILNILWLICWHNDKIFLSTLVMILLLISLLFIVTSTSKNDLFTYIAYSIYAGWISVALIANISIYLVKLDLPFFMRNQSVWLYSILGVSLLIGLFMIFKNQNYYYSGVFLWAYFGIYVKHNNS